MSAWDTTPFDNDVAADFANDLDDLSDGERADAVRDALVRAAAEDGYLEADDAEVAVAAAALVAAQCPGGEAVDSAYGPVQPLPELPDDLRPLAVQALDNVLADDSELKELWAEASDARQWQLGVSQLRQVLAAST